VTSPEVEFGRYRLRDGAVSWRDVDGEVIALDIESGEYLSLNGSGRVLWLALIEPASVDELGALLVETFGISEALGLADASTFVADLERRALLDEVA